MNLSKGRLTYVERKTFNGSCRGYFSPQNEFAVTNISRSSSRRNIGMWRNRKDIAEEYGTSSTSLRWNRSWME